MLVDLNDPTPRWLVIKSKPKHEKIAAEALSRRDIESYLPLVLEPRTHRRAPRGPVPLFPSYVFVRCSIPERFNAIVYCPGVTGMVRFGASGAAVEEEFIAMLRQRAGERGYLVFKEVRRPLERGQRVKVVDGPLAGYTGLVEKYLPAQARVKLLLSLVSGARRVELDATSVHCA